MKLLTRLSLTMVLALALGLGSAFVPAPAYADDAAEAAEADAEEGDSEDSSGAVATVEAEDEEAEEEEGPFTGSMVIFDNSVGLGTFVKGASHRPAWGWSLSIRPRWNIDDHHVLAARLDLAQDLVENADSSVTERQRLLLSVLQLNYQYRKLVALWDDMFTVKPSLTVDFPVSPKARFTDQIIGLRPGASATFKPMKWFSFTYYTGAIKSFNRFTHATVKVDDGVMLARPGGSESLGGGLIADGTTYNIEWTWRNRFIADFTLPLDLSLSLDFIYDRSWGYQSKPDDELTPEVGESGRPESDFTWNAVEVAWETPVPHMSLALGAATWQAPLTADNESVRFPFWDFVSPSSNRTTLYFDVAYTY